MDNGNMGATLKEETSNDNAIFLFGAGLSLPAGIPTSREMTRRFLEDPFRLVPEENRPLYMGYVEGYFEEQIVDLVRLTSTYFTATEPDLEILMSFILLLEDSNFRRLLEKTYPNMQHILPVLQDIKRLINDYIRKECENLGSESANYLWPLSGTISQGKYLNIFTLNYDGLVEIFCESNHLAYSDGFDPYWNPHNFEGKDVRIFKLHGSPYWLRQRKVKLSKFLQRDWTS